MRNFAKVRLLWMILVLSMILVLVDVSFLPNPFIQSTYAKKKVKHQQQGSDSPPQPQPQSLSSSSSSSIKSRSIPSPSSCIGYNNSEKVIEITCVSATLTDVYTQLNNVNILGKETSIVSNGNNSSKIWLLNAGLLIDKGSTLYINSTDTKWLKIIADRTGAYGIDVHGTLKIDSVKVTSWNPSTNSYATTEDSRREGVETEAGSPRPYIIVEKDATGTTDITNSEIAYLGYEGGVGSGVSGLHYNGGDGSILKGNDIHHLWFGFYSNGVGNLVIENSHIHDNGHYGFDPHTGTHDMIFRNNRVHDNGSIGIICSLNCYNITIEDNIVYNNQKSGIMFSRNMNNSIARNNIVSNEDQCIFISQSHNNQIYNNNVSGCGTGIHLFNKSSNNAIHGNTITNSTKDLVVNDTGDGNAVYSNKVINPSNNNNNNNNDDEFASSPNTSQGSTDEDST
jgi:mannuronan 5-epimerase